jgi:hypothetical protein
MRVLPPRIDFAGGTPAFDAWRDALRWTTGLAGAGGVRARRGAVGPVLSLDGDGRRDVLLSGSSPPYTGMEVFGTPGGGWAAVPDVPTLTGIYEDNGLTGLGGKIVRVRPSKGEWRFTYKRRQSGCYGRLLIQGCRNELPGQNYLPLPGAYVKLSKDGATLFEGETGPDGTVTMLLPAPSGAFDAVITAPRFHDFSGVVGLACGGYAGVVRLLPDTDNYACTTVCAYPLKKTLYFTMDLWGSGVMTYDSVTGSWICGKTVYPYAGCGAYSPACIATNAEAIFTFRALGGSFGMQYAAVLPPFGGGIWYRCPSGMMTSQNVQSPYGSGRGATYHCPPGTFSAEYVFNDRDVFCGTDHYGYVSE